MVFSVMSVIVLTLVVFCCYYAKWHNAKQNILLSKEEMECIKQ